MHEAAGGLLLYCPIVRDDEIEASLAYLARRFDENTSPDNFLRAMFTMTTGSVEFAEQAERFRATVAAVHDVSTVPRRPAEAVDPDAVGPDGAFVNQPDTDFTSAADRAAIAEALAQQAIVGPAGPETERSPRSAPSRRSTPSWRPPVAAPQAAWAAQPVRSGPICSRQPHVEAERGTTLALMAAEAAKTITRAARGVRGRRLRPLLAGGTRHHRGAEPLGVVVVASPWNFAYAIPAGGVLAGLMAGNTVVLKPAPETRATAWLLARQPAVAGGIPRPVVQFVACPTMRSAAG